MPAANAPLQNPLTADHCDLCRKVIQSIPEVLALCEKIEACGVDMSSQKATLHDYRQRAQALLQHFGQDHQ